MQNIERLVFVFCSLFFFNCSDSRVKSNKIGSDSLAIADSSSKRVSSILASSQINQGDTTDSELNDILTQYKNGYNKNYDFDSSFSSAGDSFSVSFRYKCTFDSSLIIPERYVSIYGLKKFITHNYVSSFVIYKNNQVLAKQEIDKSFFSNMLDSNLKKYSALLYPKVRMNSSQYLLEAKYSISIPLTDVGKLVSVLVNKNGQISIK